MAWRERISYYLCFKSAHPDGGMAFAKMRFPSFEEAREHLAKLPARKGYWIERREEIFDGYYNEWSLDYSRKGSLFTLLRS